MINSDIMNSDIIAKAEEIKQIIIDREIHSMSWKDIGDKYNIYGNENLRVLKNLIRCAEDYISFKHNG